MEKESSNFSAAENVSSLVENFKKLYPLGWWEKYGFFTEDYIKEINVHWLQFEPQETFSHYSVALIYSLFVLVGIAGNLTVIVMFFRCKSLRTPANTLVVNLAISDLIMMLKIPIFIYNSFFKGPALGDVACQLYGFFGGLTGTVSIYTLAAISLDRYYVIKYPLNRRFTSLRAKICLSLTWIYGAFFASIPALNIGLGKYVPEGYLTSCSFDYLTKSDKIRHFIFAYFVAAWVIPFVLISFCYVNIIHVVISKKKITSKSAIGQESHRHMKEEESRKQELKLTLTVFVIVGLWFLSWTPYAIVALLGITHHTSLITPFASIIPALFCKTGACLDPFIYALNHPKFREEIKATFLGTVIERTQTISRALSMKSKPEEKDDFVESSPTEGIEVEIVKFNGPRQKVFIISEEKPVKIAKQSSVESYNFNENNVHPIYKNILKPNFSNRSSSVRKMARRWSARSKRKPSFDDTSDQKVQHDTL